MGFERNRQVELSICCLLPTVQVRMIEQKKRVSHHHDGVKRYHDMSDIGLRGIIVQLSYSLSSYASYLSYASHAPDMHIAPSHHRIMISHMDMRDR